MDHAMMSLEELVRPFGVHDAGVSFIDNDSRCRLTYDQLARRAAAVAADLHDRGVKQGDTVAISLTNSPASVVAQMGVWMMGGRILSIPPAPRRSEDVYRSAFRCVLKETDCRLLIASPSIAEMIAGATPAIAPNEFSQKDARLPTDVNVTERPLVQFSSGSTSNPKGIVLSARAIERHLVALADVFELDRECDRGLSWLPLYHDMGFIAMWLTALLCRGELTLMTPRYFAHHPASWLELCAQEKATVTAAPDFGYRLATRMLGQHPLERDLASLRVCLSGAEQVSWKTLTDFADACAPYQLNWEALMPAYGLAEATLAVSVPPLDRGPIRDAAGLVALGNLLPDVEVRECRLSADHSTLDLRGPSIFDGYLNGKRVQSAVDEEGWFSTNDVGYISDGEIYIRGRADETVIVRGRNIFAEDVESVAMSVAGDQGVSAAAFRSPEGEGRFALAIELLSNSQEATELARSVQGAVTRALEAKVSPIVVLTPLSIPRTTSGKVRRPTCREILTSIGWPDRQVIAVVR